MGPFAPGAEPGEGPAVGAPMVDVVDACAPPMTCFQLPDVVRCAEHGLGGRCPQCSEQLVQNIPLPVYSTFCRVYSSLPWDALGSQRCTLSASSSSSRSTLSPPPSWQSVELSFPAFVALAAGLAPEPGERLLHLGSGSGQAVVAWSLLFPLAAASGVEGCPTLHRAASAAVARLDPDLQRRIHLHHCDPFGVQSDWHQAGVILVSAAGFDDDAMDRVLEGLQAVEQGTRVVTLSRPLPCQLPSRSPPGFALARQAACRTTGRAVGQTVRGIRRGLNNASVFIYRKLPIR
mmetsp:Transcript_48060/g.153744  ORF Transcript_48060/g.153744 Transcript_48060/m.153744 type:complete len:290 (-) Transcript_48060:110-979(-)